MPNTYTAIMQQKDGWWIGWLEEIPGVNCQERTREELQVSMREAVREIIALNREAAIAQAEPGYAEELLFA